MDITTILVLFFSSLGLLVVLSGIKVVPQSKVFIIERFGRYDKTLTAGLNFIVPFLQQIAKEVNILERQLPASHLRIITKDNVEVELEISVFYRIMAAEKSHYRIADLDQGVTVLSASIIRSACGELEFDEIQSQRDKLKSKIKAEVGEGTAEWGIEVTKAEVLDVKVDDVIRKGMQLQLEAERERRALVLKAEGDKKSMELEADAKLYKARKDAEAIKIDAEANAYATRIIAEAIEKNGQSAVDFEIMKKKVEAIEALAKSENTKLLVLPTDVTGTLGGLETITEIITNRKKE